MAEAEAPPKGGSPLAMITRKVGPLPVWAYAALVVLGYVLYKHFRGGSTGSGTSGASSTTSADGSGTYVPPFDAASGSIGGGIGAGGLGSTVYNYYYGDQGSGQASGGGTSSGTSTPGGQRGVDPGPIHFPISYPGLPVTNPAEAPSAYQVPVSTQVGPGGSRASGVAGLV